MGTKPRHCNLPSQRFRQSEIDRETPRLLAEEAREMPRTPSPQGSPLAAGRHALLEPTAAQVSMIDSQPALGRRFGVHAASQKQFASYLSIVFWMI